MARVLREGKPFALAGHTVLRHKQGRWRPIADSGAPVRNEAGEIDGVVLVFRDQTARTRGRAASCGEAATCCRR